jgi:hypothetical protein
MRQIHIKTQVGHCCCGPYGSPDNAGPQYSKYPMFLPTSLLDYEVTPTSEAKNLILGIMQKTLRDGPRYDDPLFENLARAPRTRDFFKCKPRFKSPMSRNMRKLAKAGHGFIQPKRKPRLKRYGAVVLGPGSRYPGVTEILAYSIKEARERLEKIWRAVSSLHFMRVEPKGPRLRRPPWWRATVALTRKARLQWNKAHGRQG